ncbi:S8 family serine peptidase [Paraburkholderia madseniana]|uniref:S8 family serine peptidase n=1 Tax=Paraburkholderia madseniana TaxID=2599607 RepID=A0A6N6W658_9BURK|nr:S53 family peptidase [Paraburkholderia madseniana]KAE8756112.1 S8 family serine peptidase [Paraburkholderia madseniana]
MVAIYVPIRGSERTLLPDSRPAGPIDPKEIASVTVRVRSVGDPRALVAKAYELASKPLARRKYLTLEELEKKHGADRADLDKIEHFAYAHNLTVVHRSAIERSIVLKGRLGDLLAAFHADVQLYHHATGTYRGRRGEISVPQTLESVITGVFGLDTRPKSRSPHRLKSATFDGPGGQNGVAATVFASRYNFPVELGDTTLDGAGQTIAIIELGGGYQNSDLQAFFQEIGSPVPDISSVSVDHAGNNPTSGDSADGEVMLDIEVAGAVTPKANIVIYFAPNNNGDQGMLDAISAAVHDSERKPGVISISWGMPEDYVDKQALDAYHELFATAGTLGITVCVSSGDHGTADLSASQWTDRKIHVDHPASDDLVLACGGTQIDSASGQDVTWNDGTPFNVNVYGGGGWASGGGVSEKFPVPDYQANANLPVSLDNGQPGRGVPDIAMSATNYFTRVDTYEGASGGTSAVAPLMAALIAKINQAKQKNVGFLNPFLYGAAANGVVHDVTVGTNAITDTVQGYDAGPGWDACTGLGTPDGTAILNDLP